LGGWLGWGMLSHPVLPGMFSIDNEFLLVHLAYGTAGYLLFVLIAAEAFRGLIVRTWRMRTPTDHAFAISLLGALTVFYISITTAYMGEQTPQIAFLLIGWIQSIRPSSQTTTLAQEDTSSSKYAFRRVFQ
jgi:hypothetical protein